MSNDDPADFRQRLSQIPRMDERPVAGLVPDDAPASTAPPRPPVVRRPAPVARPIPAAIPVPASPPVDEPAQAPWAPDDPETIDPGGDFTGRKRRRWPLVLFVLFAIGALAIIIPLFMARRVFNSIERVPVASALTAAVPEGTNILLVGTDSRAGIDGSTENAAGIIGEPVAGERTDTIMVLRIEEDGSKFLSLPRDLWLPINGGSSQRINTAFRQGPEAVINTVQSELGIPISHYVQVDLAGFIDLVDAVGGVEITIPHPATDSASGLNLPEAGPVTLDSTQALAYVRSRRYTEIINGERVQDPTSDLGRVQRQQEFMRALMLKVTSQRDPLALNDMGNSIADAIVMDDATSLTQALRIADSLRRSTPESVVLPTTPDRVGNASVLVLTNEAPAVLAQFGG